MQVLIIVGSSIFLVGGVEALWEMMQGEETSSFRLISLVVMDNFYRPCRDCECQLAVCVGMVAMDWREDLP